MPKITITLVETIDHDGRVSNDTLVDAGDVDSYNPGNYDDFKESRCVGRIAYEVAEGSAEHLLLLMDAHSNNGEVFQAIQRMANEVVYLTRNEYKPAE